MIDIISLEGIQSLAPPAPAARQDLEQEASALPRGTDSPRGTDTVEISSAGLALSRAAESSSLRLARNRAIRAEIQAGTYETPERLTKTVDRLMAALSNNHRA